MSLSLLPSLRRHITAISWLLVAVVFLLDLLLPTTYAIRLLYIGVVLLGLWSSSRWLSLELAGVATVLSVGHVLAGAEGVRSFGDLLGRLTNLHGMWVTAAGVTLHRRGVRLREAARRGLERSRKDLDDIWNALDQSAIVSTTTVEGDITYVNDRFCEISQYSRQELLGQNHRMLNSGHHPPELFAEMYRTLDRGEIWRGELCNKARDGTLFWVDTTIIPFLDDAGRPYQYIAVHYDISDRKRSESALRQQEALAQMGKMAAVVAHEVRNPLAGIRGALQVIGSRLPAGSSEVGVVDEIVSKVDTLNDIVQDLLLFARPRPLDVEPVPVQQLVGDTVALVREDPRFSGLRIETAIDNATIVADREQIKLVLLNLVLNAAQSMPHEGTVQVQSGAVPGGHEIRVIDQGPGIPSDIRERLFEPFFTTKSRGTGLGLPTARRIVESHGGEIRLECPPGGGTTAIVILPVDGPA